MYGIPIELILPIYIIQLALIPAYLKRYEVAYIIGMIVAIFVALTYRDATTIARTIPILQWTQEWLHEKSKYDFFGSMSNFDQNGQRDNGSTNSSKKVIF